MLVRIIWEDLIRTISSLNSSQAKLISKPGSDWSLDTSQEEIVPKVFWAMSNADQQDLLEQSAASKRDTRGQKDDDKDMEEGKRLRLE